MIRQISMLLGWAALGAYGAMYLFGLVSLVGMGALNTLMMIVGAFHA